MPKDIRDTDQFATIQPADLNLGGDRVQDDYHSRTANKSNLLPLAVGALIVLIGIWVFVFLPDNVSVPDIPDANTSIDDQGLNSANQQPGKALSAEQSGGPAPFEVLDAERARKNTEATLAEFVQLQIQLEDSMQVKQWAPEKYSHVIAIANQGDVLFLEAKYKQSMLKYTEGSTALKALVAYGEAQFSSALEIADQALNKLDPELAKQSFLDAAVIHPDNQRVVDGLLRANNIPEVLKLLKKAEKSIANTQFEEAHKLYRSAQLLDPEMPGIQPNLKKLQLRIRERNFRKYLSEAYAALNAGKYEKSEKSFAQAARIKPGHASIRDGLRQLESARLLVTIAAIETQADAQIQAEQWTTLPETYAAALELDPNLQFAREGIRMAKKRARMDSILSQIIASPGKLSSDTDYQKAVSAFSNANALKHQGPRLIAQLTDIRGILENAAIPVVFLITSDNITEVGIVHRGSLGVFKSKTVELRPGSYIFTGSRPGCRDLRKEVRVIRGMNNIVVQCEESI